MAAVASASGTRIRIPKTALRGKAVFRRSVKARRIIVPQSIARYSLRYTEVVSAARCHMAYDKPFTAYFTTNPAATLVFFDIIRRITVRAINSHDDSLSVFATPQDPLKQTS